MIICFSGFFAGILVIVVLSSIYDLQKGESIKSKNVQQTIKVFLKLIICRSLVNCIFVSKKH